MQKASGFTLIELIITVGIVCILVAFAIPTYDRYAIRARIAEGLGLAAAAKMAVVETYHANGSIADQNETGFETPASTNNVDSIIIADDGSGIITITYTVKAGDGSITLVPTLAANIPVTWNCTGGSLLDKYRPAECR